MRETLTNDEMIEFFRRSGGKFKILHSYTRERDPEYQFTVKFEGETKDGVLIKAKCRASELPAALTDVYRRVKRHTDVSSEDGQVDDQDEESSDYAPALDEPIRRDEKSIPYWIKTARIYAASKAGKPIKQLTEHDYAAAQILAIEAGEDALGGMLGQMVLFQRHTETLREQLP